MTIPETSANKIESVFFACFQKTWSMFCHWSAWIWLKHLEKIPKRYVYAKWQTQLTQTQACKGTSIVLSHILRAHLHA